MVNDSRRQYETNSRFDTCLRRIDQKMAGLVASSAKYDRLPRFDGDDAADYHLNSGGQRIRGRLALSASLALDLSEDDAVAIGAAVELLHNASLIHDDIQDRDLTRRARDAVWSRYGSNVAICTGDLLISAAFASIASLNVTTRIPDAIALMHERVAYAIRGQTLDLSFNDQALSAVEIYDAVALAKSGAFLSLPLELAFVAAEQRMFCHTARRAAGAFAIAYQIADDIADAPRDRSVNILSVLKASGVPDPSTVAQHRARNYLETACRLGLSLPRESGAVLVTACKSLSESLSQKSDMACAHL